MSAANVLKFIKEKEAEFVDLRFTDPRGKLQHLTMDSTIVDEKMLNDGVFLTASIISQKSTAVLCEVKGSKKNLEVSGFSIISDSLIAFHPAIEDPSKKTPSLSIFSSTLVESIVK